MLRSGKNRAGLFGFLVHRVLLAEPAVFLHFDSVRVVLFVLHGVVISLLALVARQSDFGTHGLFLRSCSVQSKKGLPADFGHR